MQWNSLACLFSFRLTPTLFFDWCTILRSVKRSRQVHYTDRKHIPIPICHSINFLGVFPTFSPIKKQRKEEKKKISKFYRLIFYLFFRQKDRNDSPLFKLLENLKFESRFIELFIFFFSKKPPSGRTGSCLQNLFFFFFFTDLRSHRWKGKWPQSTVFSMPYGPYQKRTKTISKEAHFQSL